MTISTKIGEVHKELHDIYSDLNMLACDLGDVADEANDKCMAAYLDGVSCKLTELFKKLGEVMDEL